MFTIGESRTFPHANDTQVQQVAPSPRPGRFYTETPLDRERRLQIQREQRRRRRQQESGAERTWLSTTKATPTTRVRGTGDWNIRGIMIFLHHGKPNFISLAVSPPIYRSKSAKFHLCTTARGKIIFMRTSLPNLCSVFVVVVVFF